jgi:hypothetical protein
MALRIKDSRFVKVWDVKEGKYGKEFNLGTSRKDKEGNYKNSNWWGAKFVGTAKDFGDTLQKGDTIKIVSAQLENVYVKESQKTYFNLVIFEAELEEQQAPPKQAAKKSFTENVVETFEDDSEFPF